MSRTAHIYMRWMRDRRRSTVWWSLGIALVSAVTAAFYPSLSNTTTGSDTSGAMSSLLGLGEGIDPRTPVGFLWSFNYSNQLPWLLMALGIALGTASIAGDESDGTLEYLLSKPVTRTEIAMARFAGMVTVLVMPLAGPHCRELVRSLRRRYPSPFNLIERWRLLSDSVA